MRRMQDQRREIKARRRAEDRAQRLARADALTGLPNRRQFEDRLRAALRGVASGQGKLALMMIDLDRFKPVNDVFGHAVGDQVLIAFAKRAADIVGERALLARFGGDEFALMLGTDRRRGEPARVARRLIGLFEGAFGSAMPM